MHTHTHITCVAHEEWEHSSIRRVNSYLVTFYSSLVCNNEMLVINYEEAGEINDGASILGNGQLYKEWGGSLSS